VIFTEGGQKYAQFTSELEVDQTLNSPVGRWTRPLTALWGGPEFVANSVIFVICPFGKHWLPEKFSIPRTEASPDWTWLSNTGTMEVCKTQMMPTMPSVYFVRPVVIKDFMYRL